MDFLGAKTRIQKLKKLVAYHRALYHTFDAPEISDAAFDALQREIQDIETKFPELKDKDFSHVVGATPLSKFEKVTHEEQMYSLNDAFSEDEVRDWVTRMENELGNDSLKISDFYCELKIDGLAIELIYENGILSRAITRGDGKVGEDVTQNIRTIPMIPQTLEKLGVLEIPKKLTVRGEIFLTKKDLLRVNREQEEKGLKPYANTRNLAAGSVRQLDPTITASRKLQSFQYDIVGDEEKKFSTHEEKHKALASWGFCVNDHNARILSVEKIFAFRDTWEKEREKLPYEIDGIVVFVNNAQVFNALGFIGKAPRGGIAYKFTPREATTIVKEIRVQVGRTGVLTPVADLSPVTVGGTTITHATLHNADEIERLGLKIGDTVVVSRAGDVIPKITKVIPELRTGKEKKFVMPKKCPFDDARVIIDGALHKCENPSCGARHKEALYHFVSRHAFDMRGLGTKVIDRFLDEGLINDAADIFSIQKGDIEVLERFGEKSAENIILEIQQKREITLDKFLFSLGILHVGEETARVIAKKFPVQNGIEEIIAQYPAVPREAWEEIRDIGPKVSESIYAWFHVKKNIELLKKFLKVGVRIHATHKKKKHLFSGETFVLTGSLSSMSREAAKELVRDLGGETSESVSKKTNYVVVGKDPGSKFDQAKKLGVKVLNEEEFLKLIHRA